MRFKTFAIVPSVLAAMGSGAAPALAETIRLEAQFVREDGSAMQQFPVRIVVGGGANARLPDAGQTVTTDAEGRVLLSLEAPLTSRRITLDNWFVRHNSQLLEIGVELELLGRRALYWVELDQVKAGTLGVMHAFVAGSDGNFDQMLKFHDDVHSWSIPGDEKGMLMSGIGAELRFHEMEEAPGRGWTVRLTIEKQEFTQR